MQCLMLNRKKGRRDRKLKNPKRKMQAKTKKMPK